MSATQGQGNGPEGVQAKQPQNNWQPRGPNTQIQPLLQHGWHPSRPPTPPSINSLEVGSPRPARITRNPIYEQYKDRGTFWGNQKNNVDTHERTGNEKDRRMREAVYGNYDIDPDLGLDLESIIDNIQDIIYSNVNPSTFGDSSGEACSKKTCTTKDITSNSTDTQTKETQTEKRTVPKGLSKKIMPAAEELVDKLHSLLESGDVRTETDRVEKDLPKKPQRTIAKHRRRRCSQKYLVHELGKDPSSDNGRGDRVPQLLSVTGGGGLARVWGRVINFCIVLWRH